MVGELLTQRLGRSGRKEGESSVIRIYIAEDEPDQTRPLPAFSRTAAGDGDDETATREMV